MWIPLRDAAEKYKLQPFELWCHVTAGSIAGKQRKTFPDTVRRPKNSNEYDWWLVHDTSVETYLERLDADEAVKLLRMV